MWPIFSSESVLHCMYFPELKPFLELFFQSCSKPFTYAVSLNELGADVVHQYIGQEPSGRMFNELCLDYSNKVWFSLTFLVGFWLGISSVCISISGLNIRRKSAKTAQKHVKLVFTRACGRYVSKQIIWLRQFPSQMKVLFRRLETCWFMNSTN